MLFIKWAGLSLKLRFFEKILCSGTTAMSNKAIDRTESLSKSGLLWDSNSQSSARCCSSGRRGESHSGWFMCDTAFLLYENLHWMIQAGQCSKWLFRSLRFVRLTHPYGALIHGTLASEHTYVRWSWSLHEWRGIPHSRQNFTGQEPCAEQTDKTQCSQWLCVSVLASDITRKKNTAKQIGGANNH